MGALFEQDIPLAQHLCELKLVPYQEAVLQLRNNWFLIYSPSMFTAYVICLNSSSSAIPIKVGVNQVFISPSCTLELKNHTTTSDLLILLTLVAAIVCGHTPDHSLPMSGLKDSERHRSTS